MTVAKVGQVTTETARDSTAVSAKVGQVVTETSRAGTAVRARVGQVVVEVARANGTVIPITQSTQWIST